MGRNLEAWVEVRLFPEDSWRLLRSWPFTDRHNGFYDDLDAQNTFLPQGSPIDPRTLAAADLRLEDWVCPIDEALHGIRYVTAEAWISLLDKWENDDRGKGYALGHDEGRHDELIEIGRLLYSLTAKEDRENDDDERPAVRPQARVLYGYGCPLERMKPYRFDFDKGQEDMTMDAPGDTLKPDAVVEPRRTAFDRKVTQKELSDGAEILTCGHAAPGKAAFLFDGLWIFAPSPEEPEQRFEWACVCPQCATASNFDLARVAWCEVVSFHAATPEVTP